MRSEKPVYPDLTFASDVEYFRDLVWPDYQDFLSNPSLRNAFHLATSLNQMLDWHWHTLKRGQSTRTNGGSDWGAFRKEMEGRCPELALVRDLCDASKHCGLDRGPVELKKIAHAIRSQYGGGGYGGPGGYNTVACFYESGSRELLLFTADGKHVYFKDVATSAFSYWNGIITSKMTSGLAP